MRKTYKRLCKYSFQYATTYTLTVGFADEIQNDTYNMCHKEIMAGSVHSEKERGEGQWGQNKQ